MKLFKIDEYKLYEKYFEQMSVGEFFALDDMPKGVEMQQMKALTDYLKVTKAKYLAEEGAVAADFDKKLIAEIVVQNMIDEYELSVDELAEVEEAVV